MKEWFHILELLVSVVNHAPVIMFGIDMCGKFTLFRGKGLENLELSPDELVGASIFDYYSGHLDMCNLVARSMHGEFVRGDFFVQDTFYEAILSPSYCNDGSQTGVSGVLVNITERKQFEQTLMTMSSKLELLNREKNDFMGIVAHDLKNPLTGIRGSAELLLRDAQLKSPERALVGQVVDSCNRMFELIGNLLDTNAIEQGRMSLKPSEFNISLLAHYVVEVYTHRANEKNITLSFTSESETVMAFANENATMQALDNLISNAIKYSPHGKTIHIRVRCTQKPRLYGKTLSEWFTLPPIDLDEALKNPFTPCIRIEVEDEGPGLSDEDKKALFTKFAKLSARPTGNETSTGLGLSIVKKLVEGMEGRVWCESQYGSGAIFIVELPLVQQEEVSYAMNGSVVY